MLTVSVGNILELCTGDIYTAIVASALAAITTIILFGAASTCNTNVPDNLQSVL